jgi:hypothetical protein
MSACKRNSSGHFSPNYLKVYKIFCLFDRTLCNAYVLHKITSQKLKYNQFRIVVAEELLDGLIMLKYAR